jgi:hypothetical protein
MIVRLLRAPGVVDVVPALQDLQQQPSEGHGKRPRRCTCIRALHLGWYFQPWLAGFLLGGFLLDLLPATCCRDVWATEPMLPVHQACGTAANPYCWC